MRLIRQCDEVGVPVLNRVDRLAVAGKSRAADCIARAGLRTPRMEPIDDVAAFRRDALGMPLPLFVREDLGHQGRMLKVETMDELRQLPLDSFRQPVAVEFVDVRDDDGIFRKYRYIAAGHRGVSHHVQVSDGWITRGRNRALVEQNRAAELAYIERPDPNHSRFQRARELLGLDFVAFDYGRTVEGEVVVWEINPFPGIGYARTTTKYRNFAIDRTMAAMLALYLETAGHQLPEAVERAAGYAPQRADAEDERRAA
jgi:hypothetical protein